MPPAEPHWREAHGPVGLSGVRPFEAANGLEGRFFGRILAIRGSLEHEILRNYAFDIPTHGSKMKVYFHGDLCCNGFPVFAKSWLKFPAPYCFNSLLI